MKVETALPIGGLEQVAAAAGEAEEMGYDGVLSFEVGHDPFLPLAIAAEQPSSPISARVRSPANISLPGPP